MACGRRARVLLQEQALSVTEIGIQIGFRETSSFTRGVRENSTGTYADPGIGRGRILDFLVKLTGPSTAVGDGTLPRLAEEAAGSL